MASILKEIRVLEVGHYSNSFSKELYTTAASLHTAARIPIAQWEKEPVCTYCKGAGAHTANQCTVIKGHQQCVSIVKEAGLYFNCLVHHIWSHSAPILDIANSATKSTIRACALLQMLSLLYHLLK